MMTNFRKPTPTEELAALKKLLFDWHFHRTFTSDAGKAGMNVRRLDTWIQSHTKSPTEATADRDQRICTAFWEHVAQAPEVGRAGRGRAKKEEK
jgi:hypothetical protein